MSVYVDTLLPCVPNENWRWRSSCHLLAESDDELHAFAQSIGLKREWFQNPAGNFPHYDLTKTMRILAVKKGAIEIDRITGVKITAENYKSERVSQNGKEKR